MGCHTSDRNACASERNPYVHCCADCADIYVYAGTYECAELDEGTNFYEYGDTDKYTGASHKYASACASIQHVDEYRDEHADEYSFAVYVYFYADEHEYQYARTSNVYTYLDSDEHCD